MVVGTRKDMSVAEQRRRHPKWIRQNMWRSRYKVPGTTVALLSTPEKMPGPSWSLPAGPACPFMVLGDNTICGVCYAGSDHRGRYSQNAIVNAQWTRYEWARECMKTPEGQHEFVTTMAAAIRDTRAKWMRVHDAGDLFSPDYTRCWIRICSQVDDVRFWFPTRSWQAPWVNVIMELAALPNVTVRPSALWIGAAPPKLPGLAAGTTVKSVGFTCAAPAQGGYCLDCRRCWVAKKTPVIYHLL